MEDIIDIIVTETTNTIEITSQASDELIDVNIIDNREDITLNVTPTLVEININSLTGNFGVEWGDITGTLADQTDLNTALGLKADLVGGKVPSSQLPSYVDDIVEVANYAALPATGETGKIYVVLDTNKIYRWSGSAYIEIADSTAVWGAITGTLSSQTDLQNALNAKFDDPTGDTTQYIAGDGSLITFPVAGQAGTLVREVRNTTGATLTKGTIVYISGATGNKPTVSKAIATGDSTSAQTFGMCQANISNNSNGYVVCVGDITGLDTSALSEGVQLYLSSTTAGTYTTTKQLAPAHLVYIGVVTRSHPTQGQIEVKIQNGYELDEIHDVAISSVANNDGIFYESSTSLWKNKSIATVLGYTPADGANYLPLTGGTLSGILRVDSALRIKSGSANGILLETYNTNELRIRVTPTSTTFDMNLVFPSVSRTYTYPNATGTIALTSDLSSYQPLLTNPVTGTGTSGIVAKFNGTSSVTDSIIYDNGTRVSIGADVTTSNKFTAVASTTSSYAVVAQASGAANGFWATLSGTGEIFRGQTSGGSYFIINNGGNAFLNGNLNVGDFASTSYRLNVVGTSNFTGALSGTSATFSGDINTGTIANGGSNYIRGSFNGTNTSANLSAVYFSGGESSQNRAGLKVYQTWGGTYTDTCVDLFVTKGGVGGTTALSINGLGAATFSGNSTTLNINSTTRVLEVNGKNSYYAAQIAGGSGTGTSYGLSVNAGTNSSDVSFQVYNRLETDIRFLVRGDGNIGIGTTSLNSWGSNMTALQLPQGVNFYAWSASAVPQLYLGTNNYFDGSNFKYQITGQAVSLYYQQGGQHIFYNATSGTAGNNITLTQAMTITSGGRLLVGQTSASAASVNGACIFGDTIMTGSFAGIFWENRSGGVTSNSNWYGWYTTSGTIYLFNGASNIASINASSGAYTALSDINKKKDFEDSAIGLNAIMGLKPKLFRMKDQDQNSSKQLGFIAQEVKDFIPQAYVETKGEKENFIGLDDRPIIAALTKAVQELKEELDTLKNK